MTDVFISYSKTDRALVEALAAELQSSGYVVWWDTSLLTGDDFRSSIDAQLEAARAVIVVWTPNSVGSKWVISEAEHADRQGKLIPLRTGDVDVGQIPKPFNTRHVDLADNRAAVRAALQRRGIEARYAKGAHGSLHDRFWKEIEGSEHPEDFEQYLKEFPEGEHAAFARLKIGRLRRVMGAADDKPVNAMLIKEVPLPPKQGQSGGSSFVATLAAVLLGSSAVSAGLWLGALAPAERATRENLAALTQTIERQALAQKADVAAVTAKLDKALEEIARPLRDDDTDWAEAERLGTIAAWQEYRRRRPAGVHERKADGLIKARLERGRLIGTLEEHKLPVVRLEAGDAAGQTLISYDIQGQQIVWDLVTRTRRSGQRLPSQMIQPATGLRTPPNPRCGYQESTKLTDTVDFRCNTNPNLLSRSGVNVAVNVDYENLRIADFADGGVFLSQPKRIIVFDAYNRLTERQTSGATIGLAVQLTSPRLAAVATASDVRMISQANGTELAIVASARKLVSIALISSGRAGTLLAAGSEDGTIQLWDVSDLQ